MGKADAGGITATQGFAVVAIALAGFVFSLSPIAEGLDNALLDVEWNLLRKFAPRPAPDDIIIVGIDEASVRSLDAPPGLWHAPIGLALERIAGVHPRAIGIDLALPERSYEGFHPGLDRPLVEGLAAARRATVLVASLTIDARTRGARPIHLPLPRDPRRAGPGHKTFSAATGTARRGGSRSRFPPRMARFRRSSAGCAAPYRGIARRGSSITRSGRHSNTCRFAMSSRLATSSTWRSSSATAS
jgi:CHASE2 domain-containing sensor protein